MEDVMAAESAAAEEEFALEAGAAFRRRRVVWGEDVANRVARAMEGLREVRVAASEFTRCSMAVNGATGKELAKQFFLATERASRRVERVEVAASACSGGTGSLDPTRVEIEDTVWRRECSSAARSALSMLDEQY